MTAPAENNNGWMQQIKEYAFQVVAPTNPKNATAFVLAMAIPFAVVLWAVAAGPEASKSILAWLNLFAVFAGAAAALNTISGERKAPNVTFALALFALTPLVCLAVAKVTGLEGA